jgi:hypothetical protein
VYVKKEEELEREREARSTDGVVGDSVDTWDTPTLLMARPGVVKDREALKVTLSKLLTSHSTAKVSDNVRITAGVSTVKWPDGMDRAVYALKSIFQRRGGDYLSPDLTLLSGLDWLEAANMRDIDGKINGAWAPLAHHVGEVFSHFYQWQLAKDAGNNATIIVSADGLNPLYLAVPVSSFGAIVDHAPKSYDIILLDSYAHATSTHVDTFADYRGNAIELSKWDKPGFSGLHTYIISSTFADKVFDYASVYGAGYIESWIVDDLCTKHVVNAEGTIVGSKSPEASAPLLNCYRAKGLTRTGKSSHKSGTKSSEDSILDRAVDDSLKQTPTSLMMPANDVKSEHSKRSPEASLGAFPRFDAGTHDMTHDFMSHSIDDVADDHRTLLHKRHSAALKRASKRDDIEKMLKKIHDIRATGSEPSAKDIFSAVAEPKADGNDILLETLKTSDEAQKLAPKPEPTLSKAELEVASALEGIL